MCTAAVFHIDPLRGIKVELFGDFNKMDGTILSIKAPGQEPTFIVTANNHTKVRARKSAVTLDWPAIFTSNQLFWQEVTLTFGENKTSIKDPLGKMEIIFQADLIRLLKDKSEITELPMIQVSHAGYLEKWRNAQLGVGGLLGEIQFVCTIFIFKSQVCILCGYLHDYQIHLFQFSGEGEDEAGSQFLTGCLERIQVQGQNLDLDLAVKHKSITSHSCPG